ncbi:MAG: phenylalanine--tRNA ligase subunit alpha, partial [Candidatus Symbiobacter sp.]|nr:phenylalanine--tRNA ligase subunit alpha [Candidatus Symbiobacter sp.]
TRQIYAASRQKSAGNDAPFLGFLSPTAARCRLKKPKVPPMRPEWQKLLTQAQEKIENLDKLSEFSDLRVAMIGKKGEITALMSGISKLPPPERPAYGAEVNALVKTIEALLDAKKIALEQKAMAAKLAAERVDVTLPVPSPALGKIHPISRTMDEGIAIFAAMGFSVAAGPDIEDDEHNFTALNFAPHHPARDMHDTFYLNAKDASGKNLLLRTHTSPVQIRTMRGQKPPLAIIAPGRTYRSDSDQTHTPMFHQIEGLVIDRAIHMGHLKGCLQEFIQAYFGANDIPIRFRPSYFPFTEPSAEVDIGCSRAGGKLTLGPHGDWLEIGGSGMVHPNVLVNCGLDPDQWQGFAFGMGVERMAMLKYGIPDLRTFFDGDGRWLSHYGFSPFDLAGVV